MRPGLTHRSTARATSGFAVGAHFSRLPNAYTRTKRASERTAAVKCQRRAHTCRCRSAVLAPWASARAQRPAPAVTYSLPALRGAPLRESSGIHAGTGDDLPRLPGRPGTHGPRFTGFGGAKRDKVVPPAANFDEVSPPGAQSWPDERRTCPELCPISRDRERVCSSSAGSTTLNSWPWRSGPVKDPDRLPGAEQLDRDLPAQPERRRNRRARQVRRQQHHAPSAAGHPA